MSLNKKELTKMVHFAVVGVINTGLDVAIFSLLYYIFSLPLLVANSCGYLIAATNSFILNKYWTFSESSNHGQTHRQFVLFIALGLLGLALSNIVVWSLSAYISEIAAKLWSVGVLFIWNFGTSRFIVFPAANPPTRL